MSHPAQASHFYRKGAHMPCIIKSNNTGAGVVTQPCAGIVNVKQCRILLVLKSIPASIKIKHVA